MTEAEVITIIQAAIVANGNNEITANVLRPVLLAMLEQPNDKMGELSDLDTTDKSTLVAAINEALANGGGGSTFTVHSGTDNPNTTPPASYSLGDWYIRNGTSIYQYNGSQWVPILNPIVYAFSEKDPYFEATEGQTEFFIDADTVNVDIWVGGTYQVEGQDYTRDEDTITMTYGLTAGDRVTVRQYKFDGASTADGIQTINGKSGETVTLTEEDIFGTATYNGATTGASDLDVSVFSSHFALLTGNTVHTLTGLPASGKGFAKTWIVRSTATETYSIANADKVVGEYLADGTDTRVTAEISIFPTIGQYIVVTYENLG